MKRAFVNIVTWVSDKEEFKNKAEFIVEKLGGLFVSELLDPESVEARMGRTGMVW